MPEIATIKQKRERRLQVPVNRDGDFFTLTWNPVNVSETVMDQVIALQKSTEGKKAVDVANIMVLPIVTSWDLTDGGEPYPLTGENIAGLGLDILQEIAVALYKDFNLGNDAKKVSAGG